MIYCNFLDLFYFISIISHFIFSTESPNKSTKILSSETTSTEAAPYISLESSSPSVDNKPTTKADTNLSNEQEFDSAQKRGRIEPNTTFESNPSASYQQNNERKTTQGGRCRLFIGNVPCDLTQDEFQLLFGKYGELVEYFVNPSRGFGFIKLVC